MSAPDSAAAGRLARLRAGWGDLDALVVSSLTNVFYLTGFTGSAGILMVGADEATLITDGRYETQAHEQLDATGAAVAVTIAPAAAQAERAGSLARSAGVARLGLEAAHVSWARQAEMAAEWFPGVELVPTVGLVERLRQVKDADELRCIERAATIADTALAGVRPGLTGGAGEAEFARSLDFEMRALGASGPSFDTIVAAGPNGAKPHHRPGPRPLGAGEAVVVDFGARFDGYCSDMTRTLWVGRLDDPELRRAYRVVLDAQAAGVAALRAGVTGADVDRACREVIADAGLAERFVHGTGHGVGLDIHEAPSVAATSTDTLVAGHVVTVEPGVYLPGRGGIRIEDTLLVTDDGCRPLTRTAKERP